MCGRHRQLARGGGFGCCCHVLASVTHVPAKGTHISQRISASALELRRAWPGTGCPSTETEENSRFAGGAGCRHVGWQCAISREDAEQGTVNYQGTESLSEPTVSPPRWAARALRPGRGLHRVEGNAAPWSHTWPSWYLVGLGASGPADQPRRTLTPAVTG